MGGDGLRFAGSRCEFLPEGCDIQYQRKGGCFVTTGKGVSFAFLTIALAACVGLLVYYVVPCDEEIQAKLVSDDATITKLTSMARSFKANYNHEKTMLQQDIKPVFYRLRMQPYLDETSNDNFTFDGHVSIIFQNYGSLKYSIILNVKNLLISDNDVTLSYFKTSKIEQLRSESQIKETNGTETADDTEDSNTPVEGMMDESDLSSTTVASNVERNYTTEPIISTEKPVGIIENGDHEMTEVIPNNTLGSTWSSAENENTSLPSSTTPSPGISVSSSSNATELIPTEQSVIKEATKIFIKIIGHKYNDSAEQLTIRLEEPLEKDMNYTLEIKFKGVLSEDHRGFIRSKYIDDRSGLNSWYATTLLKPTYARAIFPCFDDPSLKAKFEISIARKTDMAAVSNMPLQDTTELKDGWVWDHFKTTPPMSTYLVSMTVSNFVPVKASSNILGTVINVVGRKEVIEKATYLLDVTSKIIKFYNDYLKYNYPLTKIDIVTVPELPVDSMESWGVIYIRERIVLVDNESTSAEKELLLRYLAQKLATQWFGNLVTMKSWKDTWVTEGLSRYMSYAVIEKVEKSREMFDEYIFNYQQEVLDEDGSTINDRLSDINIAYLPDDLHEIYAKKSSCILRMLSNGLDEEKFIDGIKTYISNWSYNNSDPIDVWNDISNNLAISDEIAVNKFINSWENQANYPVVTVTRDYKTGSINLKQGLIKNDNNTDDLHWILPLKYKSNTNNTVEIKWLSKSSDSIPSQKVLESNWILFNVNQTSLCRINYDERNWLLLTNSLMENPEMLEPNNRAMLIDDAFQLAKMGQLSYEIPLNMSLYLMEKEKHYLPWMTFFKNFEYLNSIFYRSIYYDQIQDYVLKLINNIYLELKNNDDNSSDSVIKLRGLIMHWACKMNYKNCVLWAFKEYQTWANISEPDEVNPIPKSLRSTVYCIGMQMQGRNAFDFLWSRFLNVDREDEMNSLMSGISCATEAWILIRYLQNSLNYSSISPYYSVKMWEMLSSDLAHSIAFEFLEDNWKIIYRTYKNEALLRSIVINTLSKLSGNTNLEKIKIFINQNVNDLKPFSRDIISVIKDIEMKLNWRKTNMAVVVKWLQDQQ